MTGGPPGWRSQDHVPEEVEPVDKFEQEVCWPDGLRVRVSGQKACVHEFQTGPQKNKFHARASQKTTSTPTRSAQRARRLRDVVNDKRKRSPATEKVRHSGRADSLERRKKFRAGEPMPHALSEFPPLPGPRQSQGDSSKRTEGGTHNPDYVNPSALRFPSS